MQIRIQYKIKSVEIEAKWKWIWLPRLKLNELQQLESEKLGFRISLFAKTEKK